MGRSKLAKIFSNNFPQILLLLTDGITTQKYCLHALFHLFSLRIIWVLTENSVLVKQGWVMKLFSLMHLADTDEVPFYHEEAK